MNQLPAEMQARIDEIIAQAGQQQAPAKPAPMTQEQRADVNFGSHAPVRQPSLMEHVIALRREVATLSQQMQAQGQVTEAVGQAVGQLYQMFCQQTEVADPGPTYSTQFQQEGPPDF